MKVRYQSILPDPDQWEQGIVGPDGSIMSRQLFEFFADAKKKAIIWIKNQFYLTRIMPF